MNREDAIAKAIASGAQLADSAEPGRYERASDPLLTRALDFIVADGGADEECGEAETHGHYARIEQWVVGTDSEGFVLLRDFKTVESAQAEFAKIEENIARLDGPYEVSRMYQSDDWPSEVVATGLTLAEAQARCQDPETSSSTCTSEEGRLRTVARGDWFEGYEREET